MNSFSFCLAPATAAIVTLFSDGIRFFFHSFSLHVGRGPHMLWWGNLIRKDIHKSPQMNLPFSIVFFLCYNVKGENDIHSLTLSIVPDLTCVLLHNIIKLPPEEFWPWLKNFLPRLLFLLHCCAISLNVRSHSWLITCSGSSSPTPPPQKKPAHKSFAQQIH